MPQAARDPFKIREKAQRIGEFIWRKKRLRNAYRATFLGPDGKPHPPAQIVLAHLARLGRNRETIMIVGSNGQVDPLASMVAEGHRVLFETIRQMLALDDADLYTYERAERAIHPPEN